MTKPAVLEIQTGLTPHAIQLLNDSLRLVAVYLGMLLYKKLTGVDALSSPKAFAMSLAVSLALYDVVVAHVVHFE